MSSQGHYGEEGDFRGQETEVRDTVLSLIRDYHPDSIIKELLQNANDAGASKCTFILDESSQLTDNPDAFPKKRCQVYKGAVDSLFGPALVSFNDAPFADQDIKRIQNVLSGGKRFNNKNYGRFGAGFNSTFHITQNPILLTGNWIYFFDTFNLLFEKGKDGRGVNIRLEDLHQRNPECDLIDFFTKFGRAGYQLGSKSYPDAAFCFPFRNEEISNHLQTEEPNKALTNIGYCKPFSPDQCKSIFLREIKRAEKLILFLSIEEINFVHIGAEGQTVSNVKIKTLNKDVVQNNRQQLNNLIDTFDNSRKFNDQLEDCLLHYQHEFSIEIDGKTTCSTWEIIRGLICSSELATLCTKKNRSGDYIFPAPEYGAAWRHTPPEEQASEQEGSLYLGLPLPIKSGIPIQIHSRFEPDNDRTQLYWDEEGEIEEHQWNHLLIKDVISKGVAQLISDLVCRKLSTIQSLAPALVKETFKRAQNHQQNLPEYIYRYLLDYPCIECGLDGKFLTPKEVLLLPDALEPLRMDLIRSGIANIPTTKIDSKIKHNFESANGANCFATFDAQALQDHLEGIGNTWEDVQLIASPITLLNSKENICTLLDFLIEQNVTVTNFALPLALKEDDVLTVFTDTDLYIANNLERKLLFNVKERLFHKEVGDRLSEDGQFSEYELNPIITTKLLKEDDNTLFELDPSQSLVVDKLLANVNGKDWLLKFLSYVEQWLNKENTGSNHLKQINVSKLRRELSGVPILLDTQGKLWCINNESLIVRNPRHPVLPEMITLLMKAGLPIISSDIRREDKATSIEENLHLQAFQLSKLLDLNWLNAEHVIASILSIDSSNNLSQIATSDAKTLVSYFAGELKANRLNKRESLEALSSLQIFPVIDGSLVKLSLVDNVYYTSNEFNPPRALPSIATVLSTENNSCRDLYKRLGVRVLNLYNYLTNDLQQLFSRNLTDEQNRLIWVFLAGNWDPIQKCIIDDAEDDVLDDALLNLGNSYKIKCTDLSFQKCIDSHHPDLNKHSDVFLDAIHIPDYDFYGLREIELNKLLVKMGMRSILDGTIVRNAILTIKKQCIQEVGHKQNELLEKIFLYLLNHEEIFKHVLENGITLSDWLATNEWLPVMKAPARNSEFPQGLFATNTNKHLFTPKEIYLNSGWDMVACQSPSLSFKLYDSQEETAKKHLTFRHDIHDYLNNLVSLCNHICLGDQRTVKTDYLKSLIGKIYKKLGNILANDYNCTSPPSKKIEPALSELKNFTQSIIEEKSAKLILDKNGNLWDSKNVFTHNDAKKLQPFVLHQASTEHKTTFWLLGVQNKPTPDYLSESLKQIYYNYKEVPVDEETNEIAKQIYHLMAKICKDPTKQRRYLKSSINDCLLSHKKHFVNDTLYLNNEPRYEQRLKKANVSWFLSEDRPNTEIELMGQNLDAVLANDLFEQPQTDDDVNQLSGDLKLNFDGFEKRLKSSAFSEAIAALIYDHVDKKIVSDDRIHSELLMLKIVPSDGAISTILVRSDGTTSNIQIEGTEDSSGHCRSGGTFYINWSLRTKSTLIAEWLCEKITSSLLEKDRETLDCSASVRELLDCKSDDELKETLKELQLITNVSIRVDYTDDDVERVSETQITPAGSDATATKQKDDEPVNVLPSQPTKSNESEKHDTNTDKQPITPEQEITTETLGTQSKNDVPKKETSNETAPNTNPEKDKYTPKKSQGRLDTVDQELLPGKLPPPSTGPNKNRQPKRGSDGREKEIGWVGENQIFRLLQNNLKQDYPNATMRLEDCGEVCTFIDSFNKNKIAQIIWRGKNDPDANTPGYDIEQIIGNSVIYHEVKGTKMPESKDTPVFPSSAQATKAHEVGLDNYKYWRVYEIDVLHPNDNYPYKLIELTEEDIFYAMTHGSKGTGSNTSRTKRSKVKKGKYSEGSIVKHPKLGVGIVIKVHAHPSSLVYEIKFDSGEEVIEAHKERLESVPITQADKEILSKTEIKIIT